MVLVKADAQTEEAPFGHGAELEIRPIMGMDDFGESFTPELRAREERMRELTGARP